MQCKKKKNKFICVFCSFLILVCGLLQSSALSIGSYASNSGSTMTVDQYLRSINFYDACAYAYRSIGAIPDNIGGGSVTFALFEQYLADNDKEELLQEPVTVVEGASGGRGYEVPQDVRQEMINFINTNVVEANPLSYEICKIPSINFINVNQWATYQQYESIKTYGQNNNGYILIRADRTQQNNAISPTAYVTIMDRDQIDFVGTVSSGAFINVRGYHNWQEITLNDKKFKVFNQNGTTSEQNGCGVNQPNLHNYTTTINNAVSVFTNSNKDELVYVFNTLQALKNYNAGTPQPYYLLTDPNYIAPLDEIWTNEGLSSAGNFYNNIVNNVSTGSTPNQIQDTTRDVLNGVIGGNTGSTDSGFDLGFLGTIGEVIKSVTGAFTPVNSLITGELSSFISDVFGWLPQEIVILWVAGIIFAVLFGILKLIRG